MKLITNLKIDFPCIKRDASYIIGQTGTTRCIGNSIDWIWWMTRVGILAITQWETFLESRINYGAMLPSFDMAFLCNIIA